jgi:threonine dehydrogenase-like Zn-dependent dehydrogenase
MKAAVVYGKNEIRIAEVPRPRAGKGEVVVKVRASGVCATDVKILGGAGTPAELPAILGHEVAGTVAELGAGAGETGLHVGQRVAVYPIAACGECLYCRRGRNSLCLHEHGLGHGDDGGFAEFVRIPAEIVALGGVIDVGDMPFDLAAMIEPVSCCLAAAEQCGTKAGDTVVVVGAGPLGLLHTAVSKALGARVVCIDMNEARLTRALRLGALKVVNPEKEDAAAVVRDLTEVGADVVIAAVGIPQVMESYLPLVRNGGVFNVFGGTPRGEMMTVDPRWIHYGEITLTGTFASSVKQFHKAFDFVGSRAEEIETVISTRCGLDDILAAVRRVQTGKGTKTVLQFPE